MSAHYGMLTVDGTPVKSPSVFQWGLNDVSSSDAGRTEDALMHKNRVARKRKIKLQWDNVTPAEAKLILTAFSPQYFNVTYFDPLIGASTTKRFYAGDQEAPVKIWTVDNKYYETITLDIIER